MKPAAQVSLFCCLYLSAFLLLSVTAHGQAENNSYVYTLQHAESDAQKSDAYENIVKACRFSKPDSALLLINKGIADFKQNSFYRGIATLLTYQGVIYYDQNNAEQAMKSLEKSILIYKEIKNYQGLASGHNIIGVMLSRKGRYDDATTHLFKSLKLFEALSDTDGITNTYIKIGENYESAGDLGNALEYYMKGLNIAKDLQENDLVMLRSSNIPSVLKDMKDNFISMKKLQKILDVSKNNSYVEVRSLPDAIKDAVYSMDGDTAKTLNYTRYALNLLLKNHKSHIFEEFSLNVKDNNKQNNPDNLHKFSEPIDIGPLLCLKNQKPYHHLVNGVNAYNSNPPKRGNSSINPVQINGLVSQAESASGPYIVSTLPLPEMMNNGMLPINTLPGNSVQNIPAKAGFSAGINISGYGPNSGNTQNTNSSLLKSIETNPALGNNMTTARSQGTLIPSQYSSSLYNVPVRDDATDYNPLNQLFAFNLNVTSLNNLLNSFPGTNDDVVVNSPITNQHNISPMAGEISSSDSRTNLQPIASTDVNNRLTQTLNIVNESIIKKNQVGNLQVEIERCKKNGDYVTATSLLEHQKMIQDSIIYLETALAGINIESLNNINRLNSKVNQLESLNPKPPNENNLPIFFAGILCLVVLAVSISLARTRLMNKELSFRENKLSKANNVKNKLISVIAHDITGSIGFMPLSLGLCRDKSIPEEEKDALLYQLELNASSSVKTLQNMLDWAKEQIQGNYLNQQHININEILSDVLLLINVAANQKNITIVNNVSGDLTAFADANHIKFVLRNLLTNAVKYSHINGLIGISATIAKDRKRIITSVSDNGIGISKENIKHIFEPSASSKARSENVISNGIGLSLCKEFVTENGGEIWVDSEKGKGSVFHFSMKVHS